MTIQERIKAPTPKFFKEVRKAGLLVTGICTVILTAPVSLPLAVTQVASYLAVAGGVASAISQTTVGGKDTKPKSHGKPARKR